MIELNDYNLDIMVGVTRKCNLACAHCLRGDAKKENFSVETLRKFLDKNPIDYIGCLTFTGGEPFLDTDLMNEVLDELDDRDISVESFFIATNGTVANKEVVEVIGRLLNKVDYTYNSLIKISNSPYHQEERERLKSPIVLSEDFVLDTLMEADDSGEYIDFDYSLISEDGLFYIEDPDSYQVLIDEGRSRENGIGSRSANEVSEVSEYYLMVYLTEAGKILPDYCDLSFENADAQSLSPELFSIEEHIANRLQEGV